MKRFEEMCKAYINGSEEVKAIILSFLTEDEQKTFLEGVGFYKLFTDQAFNNAVRETLSEEIYKEANRAA